MDKSNKFSFAMSKKEKENINKLNIDSNNNQIQHRKDNDLINLSLKSLFEMWASTNIKVFRDLVTFISTIDKYSTYFNDIDETRQWYNGIMVILRKLFKIFTKDNRPIFIGITFIFLSFALYLIQITS